MSRNSLVGEETDFIYVEAMANLGNKVLQNGGNDQSVGSEAPSGGHVGVEHRLLGTIDESQPKIRTNGTSGVVAIHV